MADSPYTPPKVWSAETVSGGRFANINRPTAGAREEKDLPVGAHPFQLYSLATPNGVKVTVILPQRIDSTLVRFASRSFFDEVLETGGEICEFAGGLLHTKSIVADGAVAMFGTANFDMRSLWLNYEVSLLVYDEGFAGQVRALQESYRRSSRPVPRIDWAKRPLRERLVLSTMRLLSPLL